MRLSRICTRRSSATPRYFASAQKIILDEAIGAGEGKKARGAEADDSPLRALHLPERWLYWEFFFPDVPRFRELDLMSASRRYRLWIFRGFVSLVGSRGSPPDRDDRSTCAATAEASEGLS